jgi:hypothetical protein
MLAKRFEKTPGFPSTPTVRWARFKYKELSPEALGCTGVTASPMQQLEAVGIAVSRWQKENPGKLLPHALRQQARAVPPIKGVKV